MGNLSRESFNVLPDVAVDTTEVKLRVKKYQFHLEGRLNLKQ